MNFSTILISTAMQHTVSIGEMFISRRQFMIYDEMVMRGVSTAYEMSRIFIDEIIRETRDKNNAKWDTDDDLADSMFDMDAERSLIERNALMIASGCHSKGIARVDYAEALIEVIYAACHNDC